MKYNEFFARENAILGQLPERFHSFVRHLGRSSSSTFQEILDYEQQMVEKLKPAIQPYWTALADLVEAYKNYEDDTNGFMDVVDSSIIPLAKELARDY